MSLALLAFVTLQRLGELVLAQRNTMALMAKGAIEAAPGHYPLIVVFHAVWLLGIWFLGWQQPVNWVWLGVFLVLQAARGWVIASLGPRWTTRIIVIPREKLVAKGPYKFVRHPNYLVVALEIVALPMVFGLWRYALLFGAINLAILAWRIRAEEAALAPYRA
jgi:methyltransferase